MLAVSRLAVVALSFVALVAPQAALAAPPTPGQVVERYTTGSQSLVTRSGEAIARVAQGAVDAIVALDAKGATDAQIGAAGERGLRRVREGVARSLGGLRKMTEAALLVLTRIGAGDEFKAAVRAAAESAVGSIRASGEAAATAIRTAVEAATGDGA